MAHGKSTAECVKKLSVVATLNGPHPIDGRRRRRSRRRRRRRRRLAIQQIASRRRCHVPLRRRRRRRNCKEAETAAPLVPLPPPLRGPPPPCGFVVVVVLVGNADDRRWQVSLCTATKRPTRTSSLPPHLSVTSRQPGKVSLSLSLSSRSLGASTNQNRPFSAPPVGVQSTGRPAFTWTILQEEEEEEAELLSSCNYR